MDDHHADESAPPLPRPRSGPPGIGYRDGETWPYTPTQARRPTRYVVEFDGQKVCLESEDPNVMAVFELITRDMQQTRKLIVTKESAYWNSTGEVVTNRRM